MYALKKNKICVKEKDEKSGKSEYRISSRFYGGAPARKS